MASIINVTEAQKRVAYDLYHYQTNDAIALRGEIASIQHLSSLNRPLTGKEAVELASTVRTIDKDLLTADYADQVNKLTTPAKVASLDTIKKRSTVENLALGYNQTPNSAVDDNIHDTYRATALWGRSDDDTKESYQVIKSAVDSLPKANPNAINHTMTRQDYWDLINMRDDKNRYAASPDRGFEAPSTYNMIFHPVDVDTPGVLADDAIDGITGALGKLLNGILMNSPILLVGGALVVYAVIKR